MSRSNHASCVLQPYVSFISKLCITGAPTYGLAVLVESFQSTPSIETLLPTMLIAKSTNSPSVDEPLSTYGGLFADQAIMLLRRFYVQENSKGMAVVPATSKMLLTDRFSPKTEAQERSTTQCRNSADFSIIPIASPQHPIGLDTQAGMEKYR